MSSFVHSCFLRITGMLLIKVHRTFDSQTVILHSHLKDIFVFLFQRILLSPQFTNYYYAFPFQGYNIFFSFPKNSTIPMSHYSIYVYWILKIGVCVCVGHLDKEYGSQSILPPWALFTNIQLSNKQHTWSAHKCKCIQMSQRVILIVKRETRLFSCIWVKVDHDLGEKQDTGMRDKSCICKKWLWHRYFKVHICTGM